MTNYFRITAYHPKKNISAIFDSNGRFEKLWQFSSYLVQKGFKIIEVGGDDKFLEADLPKVPKGPFLIVRACCKGMPTQKQNLISVHGKTYKANS